MPQVLFYSILYPKLKYCNVCLSQLFYICSFFQAKQQKRDFINDKTENCINIIVYVCTHIEIFCDTLCIILLSTFIYCSI